MGTKLNLILWRGGIIGLVALWSGIGVVTYGTYLKSESPQFKQYEWETIREMDNESHDGDPKRDNGPGIVLGVMLSSAWFFVGPLYICLGCWLTTGLLVLRRMHVWNKTVAWMGTASLAAFALLGVCPNINSGLASFRWGFATLAVGEWLIAGSLLLVAVGSFSLTRDTGSDLVRKHGGSLE